MRRTLRWAGALLLVVVAAVHLNLYAREDYRAIPTIGWLFLLTVIVSALLAVALVLVANPVLELAAALFALGVLGGYLLALLVPTGIFGFAEPGISYSGWVAVVAEAGAAAVLGLDAGLRLVASGPRAHRDRPRTQLASGSEAAPKQ